MKISRIAFCFLAGFAAIFSARAQRFCTIGVQDGLSDGFVRAIECDSEGYMWFATQDGLDRYDGYNVRKYSVSGQGYNSAVFGTVGQDAGGHLWVTFASGEPFLYDPLKDELTKDFFPILDALGIGSHDVVTVFVDEEKNLWVQTTEGLECFNYTKGHTYSVTIPGRCVKLASTGGFTFAYLDNDELWSVSPECNRMTDAPKEHLSSIQGDRNGRLWVFGEKTGFYDTGNRSWNMLKPGIIPGDDVAECMTESDGDIWIGTNRSGIIILNDRLEMLRKLEFDKEQEFSLPSNHINCLAQKNGIIWVGAGQKGATYSIVNDLEIRRFRSDISESVATIAEDGSGNLFVGYDGKGLMRMDGGELKRVLPGKYESVVCSYLDDEGTLYFGTYGEGTFIWDGKVARSLSDDPEFQKATEYSRYILKDAAGRIWIGTFNNGLVRLDKDGSMTQYTTSNSVLGSSSISSMTGPGKNGTIYLSVRQSIFTISSSTLELVAMETNLRQITQVFLDGRGILWIGTTEGLYYLDRQGTPLPLTTDDGLTNNHIQGICEDRFGNIWVTSEEGFTNIFISEDPASGSIMVHCYPYFEEDGIGKGLFIRNAIFSSTSGEVLMGNDGDIIFARPEPYAPKHYGSGTTVTGISVSSEPLMMADLKGMEVIPMKHHDNLSLEVSTLDFHNRRARYEYRIDGKQEWNPLASNDLFIQSLSPGLHEIEIRSINAGLSGEAALVRVRVRPPLYKSVGAYCIYTILLLAAVTLLVHLIKTRRKRRLEKEQRRVEEAQLKFFTNISHDLRTPLAMIMAPLKQIMQQENSQPVAKELEQIDRNARILLDEIDQILDFKQINRDSQAYMPLYGDIAKFTGETCRAYAEIIHPKDSELVTDTGTMPIMTDFDQDKLRRILHNLLSNAFKYGGKEGKAVVTVSVREEKGNAVIRVADNGPGISDKAKTRIFERFYREDGKAGPGNGIGLSIVQEFVRMHDGTVSISDNQPSGCIFTVSIPIRKDSAADSMIAPLPVMTEHTGRPRVLNVEDNSDFRAFITAKLSPLYDVAEASNGLEALAALEDGGFDLVLSDLSMPGMDGRALCRAIRADIRLAGIPVILMTAFHGKESELENLKAGADDTLEKPFDIETLRLRIENVLRRNGSEIKELAELQWRGSKEDRELLDRIQNEIEEHLQENDFSVEALSSALNISRSVLYKRIIALTGKAPIEYIRTIKLRKGKEMIESGETSVSQIAWSVGYTPKQFSRNFKAEYGCLPSEYLHHLKDPR